MICNFDSLSFQILSIEHIKHPDGAFGVKARPFAALSFRIDGSGVFESDDKRISAGAGDVLFIPADLSYTVEYLGSEYIVVHMMNCNYTEMESISVSDRPTIEALFFRLLDSWKAEHSTNRAKAYVYEILYRLSALQLSSDISSDKNLGRCVRYVEEHYCDGDLNVDKLCRYGYVSRSSLQRYFLRHTGCSPKQYIIKLRMNRAIELLSQSERSIVEIASVCGFEDEKYFSRIFKQTYGISPSHMRQTWIIR